MTRKMALIGCGAAKNPGKLPAKDKYSSNYFGLKWDYGDVVCDEQRIVSANYGLLEPTDMIHDYDLTIDDLDDQQRSEWIDDVNTAILGAVRNNDIDEVHVLLGSDYRDALSFTFEKLEERGVKLVYPFEGTSGIGEQMSRLKELTQEARDKP